MQGDTTDIPDSNLSVVSGLRVHVSEISDEELKQRKEDARRKRAEWNALSAEERAQVLSKQWREKVTVERAKWLQLGIVEAEWMYSGAPCEVDPFSPMGQDAAHKAADGKRFKISEGMLVDNERIYPGEKLGCKCSWRPIINFGDNE